MTQNYLKKGKFRVIMRKEKLLQKLYLQLRSTTAKFLSQQKYYIETLQAIEILLLEALRDEDFGHKLQQYLCFLGVIYVKFKLETLIKALENIVDKKRVGIKEAIKIISSLNASRKLLVAELLKLIKLILLVPTTNAVSKRSRKTLCRVKIYLRSSMTQELVSSCLIVTTYKNQVDKLKLIEVASLFFQKSTSLFYQKNGYFPRKFTEKAAKGTQASYQKCISVETRHFMLYTNL